MPVKIGRRESPWADSLSSRPHLRPSAAVLVILLNPNVGRFVKEEARWQCRTGPDDGVEAPTMAVPEEQMTDKIRRRVMSGKQRTRNAEHEIHAGVLACIRARRQMLERIADKQADRALVLRCSIFHNVRHPGRNVGAGSAAGSHRSHAAALNRSKRCANRSLSGRSLWRVGK